MNLRSLLALCGMVVFLASACGGGATGVALPSCPAPPTPPPPPSSGTGNVTGCVVAAPTAVGKTTSITPQPAGRLARRPISLPAFAPDRIVVKFRPGAQSASTLELHHQIGGQVVKAIARLGVQVVRLAPGVTALSALAGYRASALVEYAEQDVYGYVTTTPNDEHYGLQWHYPTISLPLAWDTVTTSSTIVAVIDSGIRSHPDLNGITVQGRDTFSNDDDPTDPGCNADPSDFSHGMHVTGTIAALTNNSIGVAGVNWGGALGTRVMPIRAIGEITGVCGVTLLSDAADGVVYAADHGAKIINMSFGSSVPSTTLESAVNYAYGLGVTLVGAVGNDFGGPVLYPAKYANVIAAGATACNNARASYSNVGPEVDIVAPGGDFVDCTGDAVAEFILSTSWSPNTGNVYLYAGGTSMAAPHVAGVLALMIGRGITGPTALQSTLEGTATDLGPGGKDPEYGSGLVNAAGAVGVASPAGQLRAFAGTLNGSTITRESDLVVVAGNGAFAITNARPGQRSVFAWQDFNINGVVDTGDYYARVDNVNIVDSQTITNVRLTVQQFTGSPLSIL